MLKHELYKIAALAHLQLTPDSVEQLGRDVQDIMDFVEQLRMIETTDIPPLHHPLDLQQRFRPDEILASNHVSELERMAPDFCDGLYLVPKVIDSGQ